MFNVILRWYIGNYSYVSIFGLFNLWCIKLCKLKYKIMVKDIKLFIKIGEI